MISKVIIVTGFYPPNIGGLEKQLQSWASLLGDKGVEVIVHTNALFAPEGTTQESAHVSVIRACSDLSTWSLAAADWVRRHATKESVVVVASLGSDTSLGMLQCLTYAHQRGARVIMNVPTSDHLERAAAHKGALDFLRDVDRYVTVSPRSADKLRQQRVDVIYLPNYLPEREIISPKAKLPNRRSVAYFGRISARKRVDLLPKVATLLPSGIEMIVQGPPGFGEQQLYERLSHELADAGVKVLPGNSTPAPEVAKSIVFINPSEAEGCSIALLEAMNRGSIPVVSDLPENDSVLNGLGYLCTDDPQVYADSIVAAIEDPKRAGVQRSLRYCVASSYSQTALAGALYAALLKGWQ
ncbi:MAG TPA: glycosyltransferase family 4 protein [Candidatus Saccharimonadales bacterium]|nr:glycosyltransferase family 4 protein [Candidatus Saccharimonadales bacterium]